MTIAGVRLCYQDAGDPVGAPLVLLHGLLSDRTTWHPAIDPLARRGLRVIALDLPGHGCSDKPRGPYLLEDYARVLDGFLAAIGISSATVCGHSLGGAIAVHFGYHYPDRISGLVLVSSGGLGREVSPLLRGLTVPGAEPLLDAIMNRRAVVRVLRSQRLTRALRLTPERRVNFGRIGRSLADPASRAAFFASLRGVIAPSGQRGSFLEMQYLAAQVPTLVVWSSQDGIIPVAHAHATHAHLPGSRLVVFPGGGHEPHRRNAAEFADVVAAFVLSASTAT